MKRRNNDVTTQTLHNEPKDILLMLQELGDKISFSILKSTIKKCKSVAEISRENNIPLSSVYRKISDLQNMGIVAIETIVTDASTGKRIAMYRSKIRSVHFHLDENGAKLMFENNNNSSLTERSNNSKSVSTLITV